MLGVAELDRTAVVRTLGAIVKTPDDRRTVLDSLDELEDRSQGA